MFKVCEFTAAISQLNHVFIIYKLTKSTGGTKEVVQGQPTKKYLECSEIRML
jgi:hypothetical protein